MSSRSRALVVLASVVLGCGSLLVATPTMAADSPEGAVNELIDIVVSGDLSTIDDVVCEEQRAAALEQFDIAASLDLPPGSIDGGLAYQIDDRVVELVSQADESAVVHLSASLSVVIDEDQARDVVRSIFEAEGDEISDEDLDFVLPLMVGAFEQEQQIDEDVPLLLVDGRWLVCGGLGTAEPDALGPQQPSVSFDGICGLLPMTELNAITPLELQVDSSFGGPDYCSYASSTSEGYHSLTLSLSRDDRLEDYRSIFPGGTDTTVATLPAYAQGDQLFVEVPEGVLEASMFTGDLPPPGFDPAAYLADVAAMYAPLTANLEVDSDAGFTDEFGEPDQPSLCQALSPERLSSLSALTFDEAAGNSDYCAYSLSTPEDGFHVVSTSLNSISLDDFRQFFPDGQDLIVAGLPAYADAEQLWVQLDETGASFGVGAFIEDSPGAEGLDATQFAIEVAELAIPNIAALDAIDE